MAQLANRYEIGAYINQGAMGTVYRAHDAQTGQVVAIKQLKADVLAQEPDVLERFRREGEALRALNHPNIVKWIDSFQDGDQLYLVMEYLSGGSLADLLAAQGKLTVERTLGLGLELADALARAHHLRIIHRDLKPANVLIADDGTPRLSDFGVAHVGKSDLTQSGAIIGTLAYAAPEVLNGEPLDGRADIWALGVMLFEMLSGQLPFTGDSMRALIVAIFSQPTPDLEKLRPDTPIALVDLIYRMLEKNPEQRVSTVRLIGAELDALVQGIDTSVRGAIRVPAAFEPISATRLPATPLSTANRLHNLPSQTTEFVGRQDELKQIEAALGNPAIRLLTLVGPGGMGKTRLSLEAAAHQVGTFSDGVYFIELAPLSAAKDIATTLAAEIGLQIQPDERTPEQQVIRFLAEKQMLLIMDNFEHLLAGTGFVTQLLAGAPTVKLFATSRERLNLAAETIFTLDGMDFPDWETPADAITYSAVKLFMQGAQRAQPGFELKAEDLTYVARICRMVRGLPLGILLAAAWVELLSLKEIATEISQSLDFLESQQRDLPERQRSIRAVFDYSWNLLNEAERDAFMRLAVFRGGFMREAAARMADVSLRTLSTLVNKSLLRRDPNSGRYEIHELLRQYAEGRLNEAGQADEARAAHAAYFADFMAQHEPDIAGGRQREGLDAIDADFENVRGAWQWAGAHKDGAAIGKMLEALNLFAVMRRRTFTRYELVMQARSAFAPQAGVAPSAIYGALLRPLLVHEFEEPNARASAEASLAIAEMHGDSLEIARSLSALGRVLAFEKEVDRALPLVERGLAIGQQLNDSMLIALHLSSIGIVHSLQGQRDETIARYHQSRDVAKAAGNKFWVARMLNDLTGELFSIGQIDLGTQYTEDAGKLYHEIGDRVGGLLDGGAQANRSLIFDDTATAYKTCHALLNAAKSVQDPYHEAMANTLLGILAMRENDYAQAATLIEAGREMMLTFPFASIFWNSIRALLAWEQGTIPTASGYLRPALTVVLELRSTWHMLLGAPIVAGVVAARGRSEVAVTLLSRQTSDPRWIAGMLEGNSAIRRLPADLERDLGKMAYDAAWERGKTLDLEATLRELLASGIFDTK